jgi:ribosomal 50S subunit-recycling heat shock protein
MRLDKFLKVSMLIKRRTIAKEISENSRVEVNGKVSKPAQEVKAGDIIKLNLNARHITIKILETPNFAKAADASKLYEIIEDNTKQTKS